MGKQIVLITTGQPSCNPRIVKEADALYASGYQVMVLYCFFINWASEKDSVLLKKVPWEYKRVGGSPSEGKALFLYTRIRSKICRFLNLYIGQYCHFAEQTQARAYDELLAEAKKIKADWYIGHNLGALAVAVKAARFHHAKAGFDFEDYYRGESTPFKAGILERITYLEEKYVRFLHYYSTASTLITKATQQDHPSFKYPVITLNNCFQISQQPFFKVKNGTDETLQLFWFSQTVGKGRGLEILIRAINNLNDRTIHLTLAGRCNDDILTYIKRHAGEMFCNIHFAGIIQPEELPEFASQFDIGLALETGFSENNNMALSNKIFTYLLAGNAIIISETSMQSIFNLKYQVGESFPVNDESLLCQRIMMYKNKDKLNRQKLFNYELARTELNWEQESSKLLTIIKVSDAKSYNHI